MTTVSMKLEGKTKEIDPNAMTQSFAATLKLLRALGDNGEVRLHGLSTGSVVLDLDVQDDVAESLERGLESLAGSRPLPESWSAAALKALVELGDTCKAQGVSGVSLGKLSAPQPVSEALLSQAHECLGRDYTAYGSVTGRLYRYSNRSGEASARLDESSTRKSVQLIVPAELERQVKESLERTVRVWGLVTRNRWSNAAEQVLLEGLEEAPAVTLAPPSTKYRGILGSDWLQGQSPIDLVRIERGA